MRLIFASFLVCMTILGQLREASGQTQFSYEPAISKISGHISVVNVDNQGAPYWGENPPNSPKVGILVLVPDRPLSVIADTSNKKNIFDQDSFFDIKLLELTNPYSINLEKYVDKHVTVEGKLLERTFGYQYTDVLFMVHKVALFDKKG